MRGGFLKLFTVIKPTGGCLNLADYQNQIILLCAQASFIIANANNQLYWSLLSSTSQQLPSKQQECLNNHPESHNNFLKTYLEDVSTVAVMFYVLLASSQKRVQVFTVQKKNTQMLIFASLFDTVMNSNLKANELT